MMKFAPVFLLLVSSLIACKTDDISDLDDLIDDDDDDLSGAYVTAKVNGEQFTSLEAGLSATFEETDTYFVISVGAVSISTGKAKGLALAVAGVNSGQVAVGSTFTDIESEDGLGANAGYAEGPISDPGSDVDTDELLEIYIKITAIDRDSKTISGEFNFKALDEETNVTYTITDGIFNEMPYN